MQKSSAVILGVFFVVGLGLLGLLYKSAYSPAKDYPGVVSVTGTSQGVIKADSVVWTLDFIKDGKTLVEAYANIEKVKEGIKEFLTKEGLEESDFGFDAQQVLDTKTKNGYLNIGGGESASPFLATQKVTISTDKIDTVKAIFAKISELGAKNILFVVQDTSYDNNKLKYHYSQGFSKEIAQNALADAKATAEKAAQHSGKVLGDATNIYFLDDNSAGYDYQYVNVDTKPQSVKVQVTYELKK